MRDRCIERRQHEHDDDRDEQDAGHRHHRSDRPLPAGAQNDGQVDDVRPRQHLTHPDQLGEFTIAEPTTFVDQHAARPRQNTAEAE